MSGFDPAWLALREPADAAARSAQLVTELESLPASARPVIADLGCGTGALSRWLATRLPVPPRWILIDRDPVLLGLAAASLAAASQPTSTRAAATQTASQPAAPAVPEVTTRCQDVTSLSVADLAGVDLITASALLDLLTAGELTRLIETCVAAGCPALLTLSVTGDVALAPAEPLDAAFAAAFNAHQRRHTGGRRLLGPDAVAAATTAARQLGARVRLRPSPWRLGPDQSGLITAWLQGWVAAACAQEPALAGRAKEFLNRRLAAVAAGRLRVVVGHDDLLVAPG